ncbi:MAG TPA: hypothetical protein DEA08_10710 [Planctomycetes bacterium]|nr:hypothetical protein [Planctomycetota bacterium]
MSDEAEEQQDEEPRRGGGPPAASEKQLGFIGVLRDKVKINDADFRNLIEDVSGKTELEDLNIAEASELIDALQTEARERGVSLADKATEKQVGFIKTLKRRAHLTEAEFKQVLQDTCSIESLDELSKRDASGLIDELKKLADQEKSGGRPAAKPKGKAKSGGKKSDGPPDGGQWVTPPSGPPPIDDDEVPF